MNFDGKTVEQPLKKFVFGPEAIDYLRCRLWEDGGPLSAAILKLNLQFQGQASAELPASVDTAKLYRFRTDIFWGWPDGAGHGIIEQLLDSISLFLSESDRLLLVGAWPRTTPDEVGELGWLSTMQLDEQRLIWFLRGPETTKEHVRDFLRQINRTPFVLVDLAGDHSLMSRIRSGGELSEQQLDALARQSSHVIVDVYDGRANLVWTRVPPSELRAKWQAGNVDVV